MTKIPFPISIGVVGAPDSGKQALGEAFLELADPWFLENDSELFLIENAGKTIGEDFDRPTGMIGTFSDDVRCHFRRHEAEELARAKGVSYLSLGTLVENIAHSGTNIQTIVNGFQTPDQEPEVQRRHVAMTMLTLCFRESFRYTFGFYLPPREVIILPDTDEVEANYNKRIDSGIREVLANFRIPIQVLDQPSVEEKAEEMYQTIVRIMENGPELPPEEESPSTEEPTVEDDVAG